jgi:hypothetical protein
MYGSLALLPGREVNFMFIAAALAICILLFGFKKGILMVLGGILAFFLVLALAAGGLWFMFTR